MAYTVANNPIARAFGFDPETTRWLGVDVDGKLVSVVRYMPSPNGCDPCETLYAQAGRGFTPNNPGFTQPWHKTDDEIRRAFARRFVRRQGESGKTSMEFRVVPEAQDPRLIHKVIASHLEAEYRNQNQC